MNERWPETAHQRIPPALSGTKTVDAWTAGWPLCLVMSFSGEHAFLLEFILLLLKPHPVTLRRGMFPLDTYFINRALSPKVTKNFQKKGDGYKSL